MTIAIIPARGGSKRIPRKNIRPFCGRPMISYAIAAAQSAGCFEHIVVSTDDAEIADVARAYGAEVPFLRHPTLADDHTGTTAVLIDAIRQLDALGQGSNVLTCAGLVVDGHAGGQDGVFIHSSEEFLGVDMTVPLRGDFHDGEAFLF